MKNKEELKTLKDVKFVDKNKWYLDVDVLKAEAVKHYKAVKNGDLIIDVPTYIRWANDLAEEDLKCEQQFINKQKVKEAIEDIGGTEDLMEAREQLLKRLDL